MAARFIISTVATIPLRLPVACNGNRLTLSGSFPPDAVVEVVASGEGERKFTSTLKRQTSLELPHRSTHVAVSVTRSPPGLDIGAVVARY